MNAHSTIEARHEKLMHNRQMEAVGRWPVEDQVRLLRQIATDIHHDVTFCRDARDAALSAMDAGEDIERALLPHGPAYEGNNAVPGVRLPGQSGWERVS